ncbi:hypothetical protein BDW62DRAFT_134686 [Aspergillus aurantiobrunneus]
MKLSTLNTQRVMLRGGFKTNKTRGGGVLCDLKRDWKQLVLKVTKRNNVPLWVDEAVKQDGPDCCFLGRKVTRRQKALCAQKLLGLYYLGSIPMTRCSLELH